MRDIQMMDFLQCLQGPLSVLWSGRCPTLSSRIVESGALVTVRFSFVVEPFLSFCSSAAAMRDGRPFLQTTSGVGLLATMKHYEI